MIQGIRSVLERPHTCKDSFVILWLRKMPPNTYRVVTLERALCRKNEHNMNQLKKLIINKCKLPPGSN